MWKAVLALALLVSSAPVAPALAQEPPANDNYLSAWPMSSPDGGVPSLWSDTARDTTAATVQADLFEPNPDGLPLGGGPAEQVACAGGTRYDKTVWYIFSPHVNGGMTFQAGGLDSVVRVYELGEDSLPARTVRCSDESRGPTEDVLLPRLRAGRDYVVQVGGATVNGVTAAGLLDVRVRFFADRDLDEVLDSAPDACPTLPGIEAAEGCPPRVGGSTTYSFAATSNGVRLASLVIEGAPRGARVEVRCRRCGERQVRRSRGQRALHLTDFEGRSLRKGDRVSVYITRAPSGDGRFRFGAMGKYERFRVGAGSFRREVVRCLNPGSMRPRRCPR
jgi:hypothetical protein